jgi:diadenylate cyclase
LPLAEAGSMDGIELGSRHRAALGITAGSDALCLVVSEETGAISVAHQGKLDRNVTESEIRSYLATAMGESVPLVGRLLKRHA